LNAPSTLASTIIDTLAQQAMSNFKPLAQISTLAVGTGEYTTGFVRLLAAPPLFSLCERMVLLAGWKC
jgi:hypothetical protein